MQHSSVQPSQVLHFVCWSFDQVKHLCRRTGPDRGNDPPKSRTSGKRPVPQAAACSAGTPNERW